MPHRVRREAIVFEGWACVLMAIQYVLIAILLFHNGSTALVRTLAEDTHHGTTTPKGAKDIGSLFIVSAFWFLSHSCGCGVSVGHPCAALRSSRTATL